MSDSPQELERRLALYDEARALASNACWSVDLQMLRLKRGKVEISDFQQQPIADFLFLLTAISRLRRAADLASNVVDLKDDIESFDRSIPGWRKMRNAMEHIDDYWRHLGRDSSVAPGQLPVFGFGDDNIQWLDGEISLSGVQDQCTRLFSAICSRREELKL